MGHFVANQQQEEQRNGPSPSTIRQSKKSEQQMLKMLAEQWVLSCPVKHLVLITMAICAAVPKTPRFTKSERGRTGRNARSKQL